jgi:hypothetical protein
MRTEFSIFSMLSRDIPCPSVVRFVFFIILLRRPAQDGIQRKTPSRPLHRLIRVSIPLRRDDGRRTKKKEGSKMRRFILAASILLCFSGCNRREAGKTTADALIAMETAALQRWGNGDPSGFLEISDSSVVYFDPLQEKRLNGLAALTRLYESLRGRIHTDTFALIDPRVQIVGDAAVLTFNYSSRNGNLHSRWNCTEVYQKTDRGWRIIQTHWSMTQPVLKP